MKSFYFLIVLAMLAILSACKKETTTEAYSFSFDMNNRHYTIDSVRASIDTGNGVPDVYGVYIPAVMTSMGKGRWFGQTDSINLLKGDVITVAFVCQNFSFSPDSVLGSYRGFDGYASGKVFAPSFNIYSLNNNVNGQYRYVYGNSNLSVTEKNNVFISGTFFCKLLRRHNDIEDTVTITNGKFKVPF